VYAVRVAKLASPSSTMLAATWVVKDGTTTPTVVLNLKASSPGTWGDAIVPTIANNTLTLVHGRVKEEFPFSKATDLADAINAGSQLVSAAIAGTNPTEKATNAGLVPAAVIVAAGGGPNGSPASPTELGEGLALLANQPVNIVVAAGFGINDSATPMIAHLDVTENAGRERIAVIGASVDDTATVIAEVKANPRIVLVAPGIVADDAARTEANKRVSLPASYAAALVAGRLATLAPHISLTNKDVAADDLTTDYTRAEQKQLLTGGVMVLQKNLGIRALKGITTDNGAFKQISVRRIVD
jgi:hypothetical protein